MAKQKKRSKQKIIFVVCEGKREKFFLNYLREVFDPDENIKLKFHPETGGNSNVILGRALKNLHYPKVYAWFDEDDLLDDEHKTELAKKWNVETLSDVSDRDLQKYNKKKLNPIVIVSMPLSVEGIIIRLFNRNLPKLKEPILAEENLEYNKRIMKNSVDGFIDTETDIEYYRTHLSKQVILQKSREINELDLLISIFN